jgi:hypothetical protein
LPSTIRIAGARPVVTARPVDSTIEGPGTADSSAENSRKLTSSVTSTTITP